MFPLHWAYVSPFLGLCSPFHGRSFPFHGRSFPFSKGVVFPGVGAVVLAREPYPTRPKEGGVGVGFERGELTTGEGSGPEG
jgi:hypothetical protein